MSTVFLLLALLPAQGKDQLRDDTKRQPGPRVDVVLEWNEHALNAIRKERTPPPLAARNLAIVHTAMHDSVVTVLPDYKPYLVSLNAKENIDHKVAAACAAHRTLVKLYPKQKARLDQILDRFLDTVPADRSKERGVTLGQYVADRILRVRRNDLRERASTYKPLEEIGFWRPTLPDNASGLLPDWGKTKPFGVRSVRAFRVPSPPELNSQEYTADFEDVRLIGSRTSKTRTAEESIIAWFWNDGLGTCTPPGHWNMIARESSIEKNLKLEDNARLFALLNLALADASIACWEVKYRTQVWRPITAIREADRDGNDDTKRNARWLPLLPTPPFPSYTSGHSTFSGAGAAVLAKFFGSDEMEFTLTSDGYPGQKRSYRSFSEAADEAGKSRIYGGIHYEFDNREGLKLGRAIGEEVVRTRLLKEE